MERRNWSLEALNALQYIDSLDSDEFKASSIERWVEKYLQNGFENIYELELNELLQFSELFYKNINFLKQHKEYLRQEIEKYGNIKKFFT